MAYWGEAVTYNHPVWNQKNAEDATGALARLAPNGSLWREPSGSEAFSKL